MTSPVALGLRLARRVSLAPFDRAARDPAGAQASCLRSIVRANQATAFGRAHGYGRTQDVESFRRRVPLQDYEDLRPWVARMVGGESGVLTTEAPVMYATTSGTTGEAKLIPVTASWLDHQASLTRRWTVAVLADHPRCLRGAILGVVSPTIEGATGAGVPLGSMSGLVRDRAPRAVRRRQAVPESVASVGDLDDRLFLVMRLALARPVAALAMPNATSLLRLAEAAEARGEDIVRAVHDGTLGIPAGRAAEALAPVVAGLRADPPRARLLARVIEREGRLVPGACWPTLELIACWLGGSAGVHARRLDRHFGAGVARRDLGLVASEGRMTMPLSDDDPAGALALDAGFFEFIPEEATADAAPATVLAHELEDGQRYEVVITGANGLARYRMHDMVEVRGEYHRTPRLVFLRKGADMVSVTGEKVHLNQVQAALREAARAGGLDVFQFRLVPDDDHCCHDLLVEVRGDLPSPTRGRALLARFDRALALANREYAAKRSSRRLAAPRLFFMAPGWSEARCRADFASGRREHQHKWSAMGGSWESVDRDAVMVAVEGATVSAPSP